MSPTLLLRTEGLAVLLLAAAGYAQTDASWWLFAAFFLAPDLTLLGYLGGTRVGAAFYNAVHTTLPALALVAAGWHFALPGLLSAGLIWVAHIGFDRALGYGLKMPGSFRETHLGLVGRRSD